MRLLQYLLLLHIYEYSNAQNSKPRTVNLAVETIFEFDNNDNSADMHIIDKIKSFLDRIKTVIDRNRSARRNLSLKDLKFTDFVRNILIILSSYDDRDLEDILSIIDEEMRKYHYKGCKFYELVENYNVRRYMAGTLENLKKTPANKIRTVLDSLLTEIEEGKFDKKLQSLCDYIDSLYKGKSAKKLSTFLENLALYHQKSKRANMNIVKVVRQGIRSVLFDHYSNLDFKTRRDLKIKLETFWRDLNNPDTGHHQVWEFKPKKGLSNNIKIDDIDINLDANSKLTDKDKSKRKHGKKSKHGSKNKTSSLRNKNLEKVKIIENRFLHDTNIAIDVGKHDSSDTDFTTKKDELSIITLYPEAIIYKHPKKHSKKHKKTSASSKKPKSHKKKSHKKTNKKKPFDDKESEEQEVKSPRKHEDLKELVHKQESEIAAKKAEMEKLLAEHEKIKKAVEAQEASSGDSSEEDVRVMKRDFSPTEKWNVKTTTKMTPRYKKAKIIKRKKLKKPIKSETSSDLSGSEEVRKAKINIETARKYYKSQDSFEGIPIESNEFMKSDLRKHYTNANDSFMTNPIHNNDDFQTSHADYRGSYPTTLRTDYKSGFSTIPIPNQLTNKTKVETRIKELENELQKVKEQIKVDPQVDYIDIPTYDKLEFWEGTTKKPKGNTTNPTTTTKAPSTTKTTTYTTKSTTTRTKKTTTSHQTKLLITHTSTGIPKFRIHVNTTKTSTPYFRVEYTKRPIRTPEKISEENLFDSNSRNYSGQVHILDANNDIDNYTKTFDANYELGFDHLDHETNITEHLAQLEEYVNTTKDNPDNKEHLVRKKMLEDLKGIMDNEPVGNYSGARLAPTDIDSARVGNKDIFELMDENNPL